MTARRAHRRPLIGRILDAIAPRTQARRAFPEPLPAAAPWARVDLAWNAEGLR